MHTLCRLLMKESLTATSMHMHCYATTMCKSEISTSVTNMPILCRLQLKLMRVVKCLYQSSSRGFRINCIPATAPCTRQLSMSCPTTTPSTRSRLTWLRHHRSRDLGLQSTPTPLCGSMVGVNGSRSSQKCLCVDVDESAACISERLVHVTQ